MLFRNHGFGQKKRVMMGYFNPVTGQLFKTRKDLDRYLAYAERPKVPGECKWGTPIGESSLPKGNASLETVPKSRSKKRMRFPSAPLVISETKAMTSDRNGYLRTKKAAIASWWRVKLSRSLNQLMKIRLNQMIYSVFKINFVLMLIIIYCEHCLGCGKISWIVMM